MSDSGFLHTVVQVVYIALQYIQYILHYTRAPHLKEAPPYGIVWETHVIHILTYIRSAGRWDSFSWVLEQWARIPSLIKPHWHRKPSQAQENMCTQVQSVPWPNHSLPPQRLLLSPVTLSGMFLSLYSPIPAFLRRQEDHWGWNIPSEWPRPGLLSTAEGIHLCSYLQGLWLRVVQVVFWYLYLCIDIYRCLFICLFLLSSARLGGS